MMRIRMRRNLTSASTVGDKETRSEWALNVVSIVKWELNLCIKYILQVWVCAASQDIIILVSGHHTTLICNSIMGMGNNDHNKLNPIQTLFK